MSKITPSAPPLDKLFSNEPTSANQKLLNACKEGDLALTQFALDSGADANYSFEGTSCLVWASSRDYREIVELLIEKGVDINADTDHSAKALVQAACFEREDILKLLIRNGARLNDRDEYGCTALLFAASKNRLKSVRILVENGANVNIGSNKNMTPLMHAVRYDNIEMTEILMRAGANPNVMTSTGKTVWTILGKYGCNQLRRILNSKY